MIIALAARNRLPPMYGDMDFAHAGGLMAYGVNSPDMKTALGLTIPPSVLARADRVIE